MRPTRVQPADRHYWHSHSGQRILHRLAFDHRGHAQPHQANECRGTCWSPFADRFERSGLDLLWMSLCVVFIIATFGIGLLFMWLPISWLDSGSYTASFAVGDPEQQSTNGCMSVMAIALCANSQQTSRAIIHPFRHH